MIAFMLTTMLVHATGPDLVYPPHNFITSPSAAYTDGSTFTNYFTGTDLAELCRTNSYACSIYIEGVIDGHNSTIIGTNRSPSYYFPVGLDGKPLVKASQVEAVIVKYLTDHPERLHYMGATLVAEALVTAFPRPLKK